VSATTDDRDRTVVELITGDKPRDLFPVGRLDKDTEGLLLITNDGKLANSLLSPKKHVAKTYYVRLARDKCDVVTEGQADADLPVTDDIVECMHKGIDIGDEKPTAPAELKILYQNDDEAEVEITITEGRYHQVKRMFSAVGCRVVELKRLSIGTLTLQGLAPGCYRKLSPAEIEELRG
jgi:16S rRNA pseudouridine516 synthase